MKLLLALLMFLPTIALADSNQFFIAQAPSYMFGLDVGVGPDSRPSYGFDYQATMHGVYGDFSAMGNHDFGQLYVSSGLQTDHLNLGLGIALTGSNIHQGTFSGAITAGPEFGIQQNLTSVVYVKENNTYLSDFNGKFTLGMTFSVGVNF